MGSDAPKTFPSRFLPYRMLKKRRLLIILPLLLLSVYLYILSLPLPNHLNPPSQKSLHSQILNKCTTLASAAREFNTLNPTKIHPHTNIHLPLPIKSRVEYYTSTFPFPSPPTPKPPQTPATSEYISSPYYLNNWNKLLCVNPWNWSFKGMDFLTLKQSLRLNYFLEIYNSLTLSDNTLKGLKGLKGNNKNICVELGDSTSPLSYSCLKKTKIKGNAIIYKLNNERHWDLKPLNDVPWSYKNNEAIWRGVSTGHEWREEGGCERYWLVSRFSDSKNPSINVGITKYVQNVKNEWGTKWGLTKSRMLRSKILIFAEGNDVSTGLKWGLQSNSAIIMPEPRVKSWLMETMLIPYVHYIPVSSDFSDLEEKINWCFENDKECKEIGETGGCWIGQFLDGEREREVMKEIWRIAMERQEVEGVCDGDVL